MKEMQVPLYICLKITVARAFPSGFVKNGFFDNF